MTNKFCFECCETGWYDKNTACKVCNEDEHQPICYDENDKYFKRQFKVSTEISEKQFNDWLNECYKKVMKENYD